MFKFNKAMKVTTACSLINFALGTSYVWTVFADGLIKEVGFSKTEATLPYTVYMLFFAFMMIFTGRFQDRSGPRKGAILSGILAGLTFLFCYLAIFKPPCLALSYGLLYGAALAFGYAAVTPAAVKWFPPQKRGFITGIVVTSHGIAALVLSPLANGLILKVGTRHAFLYWGLVLTLIIIAAARYIALPPEDAANAPGHYLEAGQEEVKLTAAKAETALAVDWKHTIRQRSFLGLWFMMALTAGTGLMLVANLVQIAELNYQITWGYFLVSFFSFFSASGRLVGGIISDKIGFLPTLKLTTILLLFSLGLYFITGAWQGALLATLFFGFSYGSLYTIFPAAVADLFGMQNFGINYGIIFTSVGIGGGLGPFLASYLADRTGSYHPAFLIGICACSLALVLAYYLGKTSLSQSSSFLGCK
jgi:OFA family oxalate/formate antiporter-like MFS transporter